MKNSRRFVSYLIPSFLLFSIGVHAAELPSSNLSVVVSAPSVAPGANAQVRLTLATPHAISSGSVAFDFDPAVFGPVIAVDAFSANGDQNGRAEITGNHIAADFNSATGGLGRLPGVPLLVITLPVLSTATNGSTSSIVLEQGDTIWKDAAGNLFTPAAKPAQFKIGGAFSIDGVTPGGGMLSSGTTVRINGRGFTQSSTVHIDSVVLASTTFIGPQEIDITLAAPTDVTGRRVVVQNPDGTQADFYPALRGTVISNPYELRSADPNALFTFPQQTYLTGSYEGWGALALQNPTLQSVDVSIGYTSVVCQPKCAEAEQFQTVTLPPSSIFDCEVNGASAFGCVGATSPVPIRMMFSDQQPFSARGPASLSVTWANGVPPSCVASQLLLPTDPVCWLWLSGSEPAVQTLVADWDEATTFTVTATTQGSQWLTLSRTTGATCTKPASCPDGTITLTTDPSLPPGDYKAAVTVTPDDPTLLPVTAPFTFRVAKSVVSFPNAPAYLFFTAHQTDPPPPPVPLNVTATDAGTPFSVSLNPADTKWLLVSPIQGATPASIGVTVDPSAPYERTAYIVATGPSNSVAEIVGMYIFPTSPPVAPAIGTFPSSLTFWAKAGGNAPAPQTLQLSGSATVTVVTSQGNWLSASVSSSSGFPASTVKVDPAGLSAGTYQGSLTFSSPSSPQSIPAIVPVSLTVWDTAPQITIVPSSLTFTASSGTYATAAFSVLSGGVPTDFSSSISTDDGNGWLSSGNYAPYGSASVVANAQSLPPGTFNGTIDITAPVGSPTTIAVPVTFVVTPALPAQPLPGPPLAVSIVNAASLTAGPISPGELLTILGLNIGPSSAAGLSQDANGLQVLFDGVPAPLLYASPTQVNLVVPYEVAGKASVSVDVEFNGERYSTGMTVAATAPAIFTAAGTGVGQASGVRGAAARGSIIHLFATGLGQTVPAEVTGEVVPDGTAKPILPVAVKIGGIGAPVLSIGSVPNQIAGIFELQVIVPAGIATGPAIPVFLSAGSAQSPDGATLAVR